MNHKIKIETENQPKEIEMAKQSKVEKAIQKLAKRIGARYTVDCSTYVFNGILVLSDRGYSMGSVSVDSNIAKDYLKVIKDGRMFRSIEER